MDRSGKADTFERLSAFVFSDTVTASDVTKAFDYRDRGYDFDSLEEVNRYNSRSADGVGGPPHQVKLPEMPLESPHWWSIETSAGAATFIEGLRDILAQEISDPAGIGDGCGTDVLAKALCQRDLVQIHGLVARVGTRATDARSRFLAQELERVLIRMVKAAVFSEAEYQTLKTLLPRQMPPNFTSTQSYSLSENYLPRRVLLDDDTWAELPHVGTRHFWSFGGRSFIKVYVRIPGLSRHQALTLWEKTFETYGKDLHISYVPEGIAPGFEAILIRSFGVFLPDGSYRDSLWPEEITLRTFKYESSTLDRSTSDFRGTLFYAYKMSRRQLLDDPSSLGLRRVMDDDEQFFGFLGDVPDRYSSYSAALTTMRSNCILCHSELHYGLSTIFSFERDPAHTPPLSITAQNAGEGATGELRMLQQRLQSDEERP